MDERARTLAQVPSPGSPASEFLEIATFALADEHYAVEARYVREVIRSTELTPVPGAPDFLVGIVNRRGEILAIFDLRKLLGVIGPELTNHLPVVALGGERPEFGLVVDEVHEVTRVLIKEIFPPPESFSGIARDFIRGVTQNALTLLDGEALLKDRRLFIDQADDPGA